MNANKLKSEMTEFDRLLVEKADKMSIWDYRRIEDIIFLVESEEAYEKLRQLYLINYDLAHETL